MDEAERVQASSQLAAPALDPQLLRALNEKVAIISGLAEALLHMETLDDKRRLALEAIHRQAAGVRELFVRP